MARKSKISEAIKTLSKAWTTQDVARRAGVTPMTVHNWRQKRGLPTLSIPGDERDAIRFDPAEVRAWAHRNKITLTA